MFVGLASDHRAARRGRDLLLGAAAAALALAGALGGGLAPLGVVAALGIGLPLLTRRRWPVASALTSFLAYAAFAALGHEAQAAELAAACVVGLCAIRASRPQTLAIGAGIVPLAAAGALTSAATITPGDMLTAVALAVVALLVADAFRRRDALVAEALVRIGHGAQRQERAFVAAAVDDRLRIARDVHDVLGHHLSAIAVHGDLSRRALADGDADAADRSLAAIREETTTALAETRRWIGRARAGAATARTARGPVLDRIEALAAPVRARGIEVSLRQLGEPVALPAQLDDCVSRIVQEALTNVVRHASAETTQVVLRFGAEEMQLSVCDDGRAAAPPTGGYGLAGMRERAAEAGGRLLAGPNPAGGWRVWASLPYVRTA